MPKSHKSTKPPAATPEAPNPEPTKEAPLLAWLEPPEDDGSMPDYIYELSCRSGSGELQEARLTPHEYAELKLQLCMMRIKQYRAEIEEMTGFIEEYREARAGTEEETQDHA